MGEVTVKKNSGVEDTVAVVISCEARHSAGPSRLCGREQDQGTAAQPSRSLRSTYLSEPVGSRSESDCRLFKDCIYFIQGGRRGEEEFDLSIPAYQVRQLVKELLTGSYAIADIQFGTQSERTSWQPMSSFATCRSSMLNNELLDRTSSCLGRDNSGEARDGSKRGRSSSRRRSGMGLPHGDRTER